MKPVLPSQFGLASNERNVFRVKLPAKTTVEELSDPAVWVHASGSLRPGDIVEVVPEDMTFFAKFFVLDVNAGLSARVKLISHVDFSSKPVEMAGFTVEFKGQKGGWSVIRTSDKVTMHSGCSTREQAEEWLGGLHRGV